MYIVVVVWSQDNIQLIPCDTEQIAQDWQTRTRDTVGDSAKVHIVPCFNTQCVRPYFVKVETEDNSATL
jgi:hypothetical protein